jgi:Domain of unknown function (DUF4405)
MTPTHESATTQPPSPSSTRRKDILPFSNAILFVVFCLLAATGLALLFRLDEGSSTLLGVSRQDWVRVHAVAALSVLSLVVLHLWTNGPWLRTMLTRLRWQTVVVAAVGLAILAVLLTAPVR